ncbi:6277_t:CDS:1 [Scutellospora calospora]|uniref:6277_t:CDS:1 n=1 Tax=Scutellospora calospora TaxID=85575 RepID=A0ACA9K021_9GLOM|nr:6277_t:CDS:1 [Scutellospora calospora]
MSEQILYDNWQKAKRSTEQAKQKWNKKRTELLNYGAAKPYNLVQQVKACKKQYDNLKKQEKDAEILYLRCKRVPPALKLESETDTNPLSELKLESDLDLEPPPELD